MMRKNKALTTVNALFVVFALIIGAVVIAAVVTKTGPDNADTPNQQAPANNSIPAGTDHHQHSEQTAPKPTPAPEETATTSPAETEADPQKTVSTPTLPQIASYAKSWEPAFMQWYGKKASDFLLPGIDGKTYKLSSYKNKNVLLIFWATWCMPCIMEIPHLNVLQTQKDDLDLQIIAISGEDPFRVKETAQDKGINYPVAIGQIEKMGLPYNQLQAFPTSLFIDKQGNVKFGTVGSLSVTEMKNIIKAPPLK
jgi:peroxiredoxin